MRRLSLLTLAAAQAVALALASTSPAAAVTLERAVLRADAANPRDLCHAEPLGKRAGVATRRLTPPAGGLLTVTLEGTRGNALERLGPRGLRCGR